MMLKSRLPTPVYRDPLDRGPAFWHRVEGNGKCLPNRLAIFDLADKR
jgi:hypothetical protein